MDADDLVWNISVHCKIWGFHGGDYEECNLNLMHVSEDGTTFLPGTSCICTAFGKCMMNAL
jgi:hypothetical protein